MEAIICIICGSVILATLIILTIRCLKYEKLYEEREIEAKNLMKENVELMNKLNVARKECELRSYPIRVKTCPSFVVNLKNEISIPNEAIEALGNKEALDLIKKETLKRFMDQIEPYVYFESSYDIHRCQYVMKSELGVIDRRNNK